MHNSFTITDNVCKIGTRHTSYIRDMKSNKKELRFNMTSMPQKFYEWKEIKVQA